MLRRFWQSRRRRFMVWVDRRLPKSIEHKLSQKNLFIFPSQRGRIFLLLILALWVLGTNYQNNLILALVFFMVSVLVVGIMHTFINLSRLQLRFNGVSEAFAGDELQIRFKVKNSRKSWAETVEFFWQNQPEAVATFSFAPNSESEISLPLFVSRRGKAKIPRMQIRSFFPFGIIRCWTWLNWDIDALVFPKPMNAPLGKSMHVSDEGDGLHPVKGGEDFNGLRQYQPGDPMRGISWKVFARGQGLFVKDFSQNLSREIWLDFNAVPANSAEQKLSILCFWILHLYQQEENFGLKLPHKSFSPAVGHQHRTKCLNALAEFS